MFLVRSTVLGNVRVTLAGGRPESLSSLHGLPVALSIRPTLAIDGRALVPMNAEQFLSVASWHLLTVARPVASL